MLGHQRFFEYLVGINGFIAEDLLPDVVAIKGIPDQLVHGSADINLTISGFFGEVCGIIGGLAEYRKAFARHIPDHHAAALNTLANVYFQIVLFCEFNTGPVDDFLDQQGSTHGPPGIVFMGVGHSKTDIELFVAGERYVAFQASDSLGYPGAALTDRFEVGFRVYRLIPHRHGTKLCV